jgi:hypothetical protein
MRAGNFSGDINSHGDGQAPAQGDVGVAAVNGLARVLCGEQHDHRDHADAEQHQHERAEKLRQQFSG